MASQKLVGAYLFLVCMTIIICSWWNVVYFCTLRRTAAANLENSWSMSVGNGDHRLPPAMIYFNILNRHSHFPGSEQSCKADRRFRRWKLLRINIQGEGSKCVQQVRQRLWRISSNVNLSEMQSAKEIFQGVIEVNNCFRCSKDDNGQEFLKKVKMGKANDSSMTNHWASSRINMDPTRRQREIMKYNRSISNNGKSFWNFWIININGEI